MYGPLNLFYVKYKENLQVDMRSGSVWLHTLSKKLETEVMAEQGAQRARMGGKRDGNGLQLVCFYWIHYLN